MIAILFFNKKRLPLNVAVKMALSQYRSAYHTAGTEPGEVRLNPAELPPERELYGLPVLPDPQVRPNHIRIAACVEETTYVPADPV
ncbi:MAG: hypothetical protein D6784_14580 [Chloroflexi bacterium]|nr:MAG: hypothetical protein D6784_14580 [Chloroflexota bacterium]